MPYDFNLTAIEQASREGFLLVQQCRDWCLGQQISRTYSYEPLLMVSLFFLMSWFLGQHVLLKFIPPQYHTIIHRICQGLIYAVALLLAAYAYLITRTIPT